MVSPVKPVPVWVLNPDWFRACGACHDWGDKFNTIVVRRVLGVMQRRRTMTTALRLPNDTLTFPGTDVPVCSVTMEELAFTGPVAADVAEYSQSVRQLMLGTAPSTDAAQVDGGQAKSLPD